MTPAPPNDQHPSGNNQPETATGMKPSSNTKTGRILVTGATGYVGSRLLPHLEKSPHPVRCLARRPDVLQDRVSRTTEVFQGDVLDPTSLERALKDVHTVYYLIHSMGAPGSFEAQDRQAALNMSHAAARARVKRIIYLGGLANPNAPLSAHLRSRLEVGDVLGKSGVPVIEFRASIIVGAGSLSFDLIRTLVDRLPIMVTPRWVRVLAQPIGIDDVLKYLLASLDLPHTQSRVYEIGGPEQLSYRDLLREYARQSGRRRLLIPVPLLTPRVSSLWLGLVTPVYARVGRALIEGICNSTVVHDQSALTDFDIRPISAQQAITRALQPNHSQASWFNAESSAGLYADDPQGKQHRQILDSRKAHSPASPEQAFNVVQNLGGKNGWLFLSWLWTIRGFMDLLVGGVGVRRGRPNSTKLHVGDAVDWWRVEQVKQGRLLRLRAEMRLPGRAWLEFRIEAHHTGSIIHQTAIYHAVGWAGLMYWYLLYPAHVLLFGGMLRRIITQTREMTVHTKQLR